jgi:hypothetical protein
MTETRSKILNATDLETEMVDVPEWDVKVEVRGMTVAERLKFAQTATDAPREHFYSYMLIATCHDPDTGEPLFELADRDALSAKASKPVERLVEAAQRTSGMGTQQEDEYELGKVEVSTDSS